MHQEAPLNIYLEINNERQDCKIGTVVEGGGTWGGWRLNEGDQGEGTRLMDFIYLYEIEQWNFLQLLEVGRGGSRGIEMVGAI
jgi:hypothetical protein